MLNIELKERTASHVSIYWNKTQDSEIKKLLPCAAGSEEEALAMFRQTLLPGAASYGRTIYCCDQYVGDIWCYGIDLKKERSAMVSYCIFEKQLWNRGIATSALGLFLQDIFTRYPLEKAGAFSYTQNPASIAVLKKQGFCFVEEFEEKGIVSQYLEYRPCSQASV